MSQRDAPDAISHPFADYTKLLPEFSVMAEGLEVITNPAVLIGRLAHKAVVQVSLKFSFGFRASDMLPRPLRDACIARELISASKRCLFFASLLYTSHL